MKKRKCEICFPLLFPDWKVTIPISTKSTFGLYFSTPRQWMTGQPKLEYHQRMSPALEYKQGIRLGPIPCLKVKFRILWSTQTRLLKDNKHYHCKLQLFWSSIQPDETLQINQISNELNNLVCLSAIFYFDLK